MDTKQFVSVKTASNLLGIHPQTLRSWERKGIIKSIRTEANQRKFNISDINQLLNTEDNRINFIYARVSSTKQKEDLLRQIEFMKEIYPNYEIIQDIGSGINFERSGLNRILEIAYQKRIGTVAIAYKDRIARIGFKIVEKIINLGGGKIEIVNDRSFSPQQELVEDLIAITTSFSAKIHGKRKYSKSRTKNKTDSYQSYSENEACT